MEIIFPTDLLWLLDENKLEFWKYEIQHSKLATHACNARQAAARTHTHTHNWIRAITHDRWIIQEVVSCCRENRRPSYLNSKHAHMTEQPNTIPKKTTEYVLACQPIKSGSGTQLCDLPAGHRGGTTDDEASKFSFALSMLWWHIFRLTILRLDARMSYSCRACFSMCGMHDIMWRHVSL